MADEPIATGQEAEAAVSEMLSFDDALSPADRDNAAASGNPAIGLTTIRHSAIPRAIDQLDDIVRGTESAANRILDTCADLEALADELGGDAAERIARATTVMYEACSFQDLAGQRITAVTRTLGLIEGKLSELMSEFGLLADDPQYLASPSGGGDSAAAEGVRLDGPQHSRAAADQADIDRLFAELG
jgi:chemotaxis protein CheZ